jgi:hypothetical protein
MTGEELAEKPKKSNKGKYLMLFNDRSGSMSGSPFRALKEGCEGIADTIFSSDESKQGKEDNTFEKVHTCFYGSDLSIVSTDSKAEYVSNIKNANIDGCTNFVCCYDEILTHVNAADDGSEFYILFMTDGQDTCNGAH